MTDHFQTEEFEGFLSDAESVCKPGDEFRFVSQLRDRYDHFGEKMYLSPRQAQWLKDIAARAR